MEKSAFRLNAKTRGKTAIYTPREICLIVKGSFPDGLSVAWGPGYISASTIKGVFVNRIYEINQYRYKMANQNKDELFHPWIFSDCRINSPEHAYVRRARIDRLSGDIIERINKDSYKGDIIFSFSQFLTEKIDVKKIASSLQDFLLVIRDLNDQKINIGRYFSIGKGYMHIHEIDLSITDVGTIRVLMDDKKTIYEEDFFERFKKEYLLNEDVSPISNIFSL